MSGARAARITITGSESTGKTWLAERLSLRYGVPWIPEFARAYTIARRGVLDASDVEHIARGQMESEDATSVQRSDFVILDTDLMSTVVYARAYYGACPSWIVEEAARRRADLYLLCDIDVPWVADPARDRPRERRVMHAAFEAQLKEWDVPYALIAGPWPQREARAVDAIDAFRLSSLA